MMMMPMIIYNLKRSFVCQWLIIINCFSCKSIAISYFLSIFFIALWVKFVVLERVCVCVCVSMYDVRMCTCQVSILSTLKANKINIYSIMCVIFVCSLTLLLLLLLSLLWNSKRILFYYKNTSEKRKTAVWLIFMWYNADKNGIECPHIWTHLHTDLANFYYWIQMNTQM